MNDLLLSLPSTPSSGNVAMTPSMIDALTRVGGCAAVTRARDLASVTFDAALNHFLELQEQTSFTQHAAVKSKGGLRLLPLDQVEWFESAGNYVRLHAVGGERFLLRQTMHGLEAQLDPEQFVRIHRRAIVNLRRIRAVHPASHGDRIVILVDDTKLRLSRAYRHRLQALLGRP